MPSHIRPKFSRKRDSTLVASHLSFLVGCRKEAYDPPCRDSNPIPWPPHKLVTILSSSSKATATRGVTPRALNPSPQCRSGSALGCYEVESSAQFAVVASRFHFLRCAARAGERKEEREIRRDRQPFRSREGSMESWRARGAVWPPGRSRAETAALRARDEGDGVAAAPALAPVVLPCPAPSPLASKSRVLLHPPDTQDILPQY